jgi:hypothetical protein
MAEVKPMRWWRYASSRGGAIGGARRQGLSHAMVHHLGWGFFLQGRRGVRNSPRGSLAGRELQSRTRGDEAQASTFGHGGRELQGTAHDKVGQNGCDT